MADPVRWQLLYEVRGTRRLWVDSDRDHATVEVLARQVRAFSVEIRSLSAKVDALSGTVGALGRVADVSRIGVWLP